MTIIKLDAIDSTNSFLKKLNSSQSVADFTVVTAQHQTHGRGQMGASWQSENSKNLICSVFVDVSAYQIQHHFYLSIATALAVKATLQAFSIPQLHVKWPNDILSHHQKICGILIENVMKAGVIEASVIGIGLNVNQTVFKDLPHASSMRNLTGRVFNLDEVLGVVIAQMKSYFTLLKAQEYQVLKTAYTSCLFRKNKPSTFKNAKGELFSGFIKTVSDTGELQVLLEDNIAVHVFQKQTRAYYDIESLWGDAKTTVIETNY